jgi:hypothetical protein
MACWYQVVVTTCGVSMAAGWPVAGSKAWPREAVLRDAQDEHEGDIRGEHVEPDESGTDRPVPVYDDGQMVVLSVR